MWKIHYETKGEIDQEKLGNKDGCKTHKNKGKLKFKRKAIYLRGGRNIRGLEKRKQKIRTSKRISNTFGRNKKGLDRVIIKKKTGWTAEEREWWTGVKSQQVERWDLGRGGKRKAKNTSCFSSFYSYLCSRSLQHTVFTHM